MDMKYRLKELRNEKGLSVSEMANDFKKAESTVRMWESGNANPDIFTLSALADYYDVTTDYLLGKSEFKNDASRTEFEKRIEHLPAQRRDRIIEFHKRLIECADIYESHFEADRVDFFECMARDLYTLIDAYKTISIDLLNCDDTLIVVERFLRHMTLTMYPKVIHSISQGFDNRKDVSIYGN